MYRNGYWLNKFHQIYNYDEIKFICEHSIDINTRPCKLDTFNDNLCVRIYGKGDVCNSCGYSEHECWGHFIIPDTIMEKIIATKCSLEIIDCILDYGFYPSQNNFSPDVHISITPFTVLSIKEDVVKINYIKSYLPLIDGIKKYDINNILINPKNITKNKHIPKLLLLIVKYGKTIIPSCLFKHMILPYIFT
jgi:hypothetical protein